MSRLLKLRFGRRLRLSPNSEKTRHLRSESFTKSSSQVCVRATCNRFVESGAFVEWSIISNPGRPCHVFRLLNHVLRLIHDFRRRGKAALGNGLREKVTPPVGNLSRCFVEFLADDCSQLFQRWFIHCLRLLKFQDWTEKWSFGVWRCPGDDLTPARMVMRGDSAGR